MATVISSIGLKGMEGYRVQVEVQLVPGVEGVSIVGLPDASVKESKDRVMAALYANDCEIRDRKVVINLSPAEQKKNSPIFDLAMAIGVMKEAIDITDEIPEKAAFSVLSLEGTIKSVAGMLPAIIAARKEGFEILYLPRMDDMPLDTIEGIELRFVQTLQEVIESFSGQLSVFNIAPSSSKDTSDSIINPTYDKDFQHVLGHKQTKRALEIAAAGGHNVLMVGPPGCGKSLLSETFPSFYHHLIKKVAFM
ncbi:magnesium chelatase domain-containing protein [Oceanobacillus salinisoli]